LAETKTSLGGVAAARLFCLLPQRRKTLIARLFRHHSDFNYIGAYVRASKTCWRQVDILYLLNKMCDHDYSWNNVLSNYEDLITQISESELPHICTTFLNTSSAARRIIIGGLKNIDSPFATQVLRAVVAEGDRRGMFSLYLHLKYHRRQRLPAEVPVDEGIVGFICDALNSDNDKEAPWIAAGLGQELTAINSEWAEGFRRHVSKGTVPERLIVELMVADLEQREKPISQALEHRPALEPWQITVIAHDDFWQTAPPETIVDLLETRDSRLIKSLPIHFWKAECEFPILRTYSLDWWLDWIEECHFPTEGGEVLRHILVSRSRVARKQLINRFNSGTPSDFSRIGAYVFGYDGLFFDRVVAHDFGFSGLTADEVTDETRNLLSAAAEKNAWASFLLGATATEKFVLSELLPKLRKAPHLSWLRRAVQVAGAQHNRRYDIGV
jgi:hypothetical protein